MISGSSHLLLRIPATEKRILTHRIFLVDVGSCYPQERPALKNALLRVDCLFFRISCEHCERFFVSSHCQLRIYNMFISIRHFIAFLLLSVTFLLSSCAVPDNFETSVKTQGAIERIYLARGKYAVGYFESATKEAKCGKFEVYYPTNAPGMRFPVIVIANGTGVKASAYSVVLKHYASWGFIIIGNEQENSWSGDGAEASLCYILKSNNLRSSSLYNKVDTRHIGIVGHSQGGVAVFNAVTKQPHASRFLLQLSNWLPISSGPTILLRSAFLRLSLLVRRALRRKPSSPLPTYRNYIIRCGARR